MTKPLKRDLNGYNYHIAEDACHLDKNKHYVVAVEEDDWEDFYKEPVSKDFEDIYDFIVFNDIGEALPFEWKCFGARVGRQSYFGKGVTEACKAGFVESIGHFTSINSTAKISCNHPLDLVFTSDEIENFFTDESKVKYQAKLENSTANPYAKNKPKITIGSDVYIGAHVFINSSRVSVIGDGAVVGSGAVVLEDVPPYAVAVGVPAKIKRHRFPPKMIDVFLKTKWWLWNEEMINENIDLLLSPELFCEKFGHKI